MIIVGGLSIIGLSSYPIIIGLSSYPIIIGLSSYPIIIGLSSCPRIVVSYPMTTNILLPTIDIKL